MRAKDVTLAILASAALVLAITAHVRIGSAARSASGTRTPPDAAHAAAAEEPSTTAPQADPLAGEGWWCYWTTPNSGRCHREQGRCEKARPRQAPECESRPVASCYNGAPFRRYFCHPDPDECQVEAALSESEWDDGTRCHTLR